ncbi:hypothetical protein D3C76_1674700 [compost metagenome]
MLISITESAVRLVSLRVNRLSSTVKWCVCVELALLMFSVAPWLRSTLLLPVPSAAVDSASTTTSER